MKHSKTSDIIPIKLKPIRHAFPTLSFSGGKKITHIKCFAVAQERIKPFSIYPVMFDFDSYETITSMRPLELVAVPQPDIRIENTIVTESEVYIVSCDFRCNIPCLAGQVNIHGFATPLLNHHRIGLAAAFFSIEYDNED